MGTFQQREIVAEVEIRADPFAVESFEDEDLFVGAPILVVSTASFILCLAAMGSALCRAASDSLRKRSQDSLSPNFS
tara:strand:- start:87 stop:317 length:231 start_codon:yes stop_codon:yes gene_type:complete